MASHPLCVVWAKIEPIKLSYELVAAEWMAQLTTSAFNLLGQLPADLLKAFSLQIL